MMKLEKLKEERKLNKYTFLMKGSDEVFANTIPRLIAEEVPTLAVEDIEIKDNNSALFDEMLGLRLGLLPIKTDLKTYRLPKNADEVEERSAECTLQLKLKVGRNGYIYAEDAESADPKCTFVQPKAIIVKLLSKQKVDVTMTAVMGQGKVHTKWSPGLAIYRHEPVIKMGKVENPEIVANHSTDGVFTLKAGKLTLNEDKVIDSKLLEYYSELDKGITVEYSDNIIFSIESWGQLTTKEILSSAADFLVTKVEEMESLI